MAEYCEFGFGMRMDANLPRLNAEIAAQKKDALSADQALQAVRNLILTRTDIGMYAIEMTP